MDTSRICLFFFLLLESVAVFNAAPKDHGRNLGESSPISIIIGLILLVVYVIILILVKFNHSKKNSYNNVSDYHKSDKNIDLSMSYGERSSIICPDCHGLGYVYEDGTTYNYPLNYIKCESCHGFKHILNEDVKLLIDRMYSQRAKELEENIKNQDEEYKKRNILKKEIEEHKDKIKKEIKAEGRDVYKYEEYTEKLSDLREKKKIILNQIRLLSEKATFCDCLGKEKDCPNCYGTGHVFTPEMEELRREYENLRLQSIVLFKDKQRIYEGVDMKDSINQKKEKGICNTKKEFIEQVRQFAQSQLETLNYENIPQVKELPLSERMSQEIETLVKEMPICPNCLGFGQFRIEHIKFNPINGFEYTVVRPCLKCKGLKRVYTS